MCKGLMRRAIGLTGVIAFIGGIAVGGYLFAHSQPRSFLALGQCGPSCYSPKDLAGLLVSAGITHDPGLPLKAVKETDKCVAIPLPVSEGRYHFVLFPKKDIKDIGDVAREDEPYVIDCITLIRSLILEHGLRDYRVYTNGPGLQDIRYLHFHLIAT